MCESWERRACGENNRAWPGKQTGLLINSAGFLLRHRQVNPATTHTTLLCGGNFLRDAQCSSTTGTPHDMEEKADLTGKSVHIKEEELACVCEWEWMNLTPPPWAGRSLLHDVRRT
jgi:hypothetical protein